MNNDFTLLLIKNLHGLYVYVWLFSAVFHLKSTDAKNPNYV